MLADGKRRRANRNKSHFSGEGSPSGRDIQLDWASHKMAYVTQNRHCLISFVACNSRWLHSPVFSFLCPRRQRRCGTLHDVVGPIRMWPNYQIYIHVWNFIIWILEMFYFFGGSHQFQRCRWIWNESKRFQSGGVRSVISHFLISPKCDSAGTPPLDQPTDISHFLIHPSIFELHWNIALKWIFKSPPHSPWMTWI